MVLEVLTYIATGITALLLIAVAFFSRQLRDWKTVLSIPRSDTLRTVIIVSLSILAILVSPFALFAGLLAVTVQGLSQRVEPDPHRPPPRYQLNLGAVL